MVFTLGPHGYGADDGVAGIDWDGQIERIRSLSAHAPAASRPLITRCEQHLMRHPSPDRELQLGLASLFARARREGYTRSRADVVDWLNRLPGDSIAEERRQRARIHLAVAELDIRYGRPMKAYDFLLKAMESLPSAAKCNPERARLLQLSARMNLLLERPLQAEAVLYDLQDFLCKERFNRQYRLLTAKVYGSFGPADDEALGRMERSLDRFAENLAADLPAEILAAYWYERIRLALLRGKTERAGFFLREAEAT
ncbi:MAG: hypothetical protein GVY10_02210, partial [Verrucomicrobia bacterium]|nr:hypothetical protein [Verrucomicrobiota bacterium]